MLAASRLSRSSVYRLAAYCDPWRTAIKRISKGFTRQAKAAVSPGSGSMDQSGKPWRGAVILSVKTVLAGLKLVEGMSLMPGDELIAGVDWRWE